MQFAGGPPTGSGKNAIRISQRIKRNDSWSSIINFTEKTSNVRVVVTGLGVLSPVGIGRESTWNALINGTSGIAEIKSFDTEAHETRIAGEISGFDPTDFLDRKKARRMDRFAQFACAATLETLEHGNLKMDQEDDTRVAVLIGSGVGGIQSLSQQYDVMRDKGPRRVNPFLIPMMLGDMAAGQVSMLIGARGPNFSTVSACATGNDSIGTATDMIRRGTADVAVAGGTEAAICPIALAGFNSCMALSKRNDAPQQASRPFDAERDGFVLGEGAGILLLESLEHATARGAEPLVEIRGYGATSDAHHVTEPGPGGMGAARSMQLALADAGLTAGEIECINTHGTSTPLNDKYETMAIKKVFGDNATRTPASSIKSMTGHLLGAAGGVEAVASVLSITESTIPPTINLDNPDPECNLDYVPHKARSKSVRSVLSNSMGFGGHNSSIVFTEFTR